MVSFPRRDKLKESFEPSEIGTLSDQESNLKVDHKNSLPWEKREEKRHGKGGRKRSGWGRGEKK